MLEAIFHLYERWRAASYRSPSDEAPSFDDGLPIPPGNLMMQVARSAAPEVYLHGGHLAAAGIRDILARHDVALAGSLLDFGCGCGRVLRRWHDVPGLKVQGCDYNPNLAAWTRANLPFARISFNGLHPPAPYRDGHFNLIYALNVLTHWPEAMQRTWMREFWRILRPGGHLLVSTQGEHYLPSLSTGERRRFNAGQLVVRNGSAAGSNLCNAFHPQSYVRETLAASFDVAGFEPRGARGNPEQDVWLLRKPPG